MTLDEWLRQRPRKWTEAKLARTLGVEQPTINRYRSGTRNVPPLRALRIQEISGGAVRWHELPLTPEARRALRELERRAEKVLGPIAAPGAA